MCNLNILCKVSDGTCNCASPGCPGIVKPIPVPLGNPMESTIIISLFRMINQQNDLIRKISEDTRLTADKINKLSESFGMKTTPQAEVASDDVTNSEKLLKILCGEESSHEFFLQVMSDLPEPAYKERAFSVLLHIVNAKGEKVTLPSSVAFTIMIFTTESPPKALKVNTSGDKIMRGTIESEGCSTVFFRKVVIKEVTSHFRNGCFFLVIAPKNAANIKPLVIPNFVIKARKLNAEGTPRKIMKLEESVTSETI